jgi:hypothetical protein
MDKYPKELSNDSRNYKAVTMSLVSACFSLWRAVFLSDQTDTDETQFVDAKKFLGKMILDNMVAYAQDRGARDWTFDYYLICAEHHLEYASLLNSSILPREKIKDAVRNSKDSWEYWSTALEYAVDNLSKQLRGRA